MQVEIAVFFLLNANRYDRLKFVIENTINNDLVVLCVQFANIIHLCLLVNVSNVELKDSLIMRFPIFVWLEM